MIEISSTNIISPLGTTTLQNYQAVKAGKTALKCYRDYDGIPEPITASILSNADLANLMVPSFTKFESIVIKSVQEALQHTCIDPKSNKTVFILSTTKANVSELDSKSEGTYTAPGESAAKIAKYLGIQTKPIVICNACISGASAQLLAKRLLEGNIYDNAIVCGADCVTKFTVAGFLSFKALSPYECKPFDIERLGLNLGEAAATIIFSRKPSGNTNSWKLYKACQTNDAYHISAPASDGKGVLQAIKLVLEDIKIEELSCISVHGTATMFNDQMESLAIQNAGLSNIPILALKGYYGHTLGAAGILESIITMAALDDGWILPSKGFEEIGVSGQINISNQKINCPQAKTFLKIISGFGGCNGALLYTKNNHGTPIAEDVALKTLHAVHINETSYAVDGIVYNNDVQGEDLLTLLYKSHIGDYPKFYKMDTLSKLFFVATHFLLKDYSLDLSPNLKILLFNKTSSILSDKKHIKTYSENNGFYPSPSTFLYTLPNIAIGEVAIKYNITGETTLYILSDKDESIMDDILCVTKSSSHNILIGWMECNDKNKFAAELKLLTYK